MGDFKTPIKLFKQSNSIIKFPPSPQMKQIGFGTGVAVYELQRSPIPGKFRSPWAVKKLIKSVGDRNHDLAKSINDRMETEADVLRKLSHPNVVGFRAFTKNVNGTNILAMEECTSSLGDLIENRLDHLGEVPYPAKVIIKVSHDVLKALNYLHHDVLLLHCDIKSYNILIKGDFEVCKLCDFGVCLPLTESGEVDLKKTGKEVEYTGTPCWCPPEVFKPIPEITTKADIYSFGLVIWEMLALSPPLSDHSLLEVDKSFSEGFELETKREKQRPDLPDVDLGPEYNLVLEMYFWCTAFEKDKRPSALNLVKFLDEILGKK